MAELPPVAAYARAPLLPRAAAVAVLRRHVDAAQQYCDEHFEERWVHFYCDYSPEDPAVEPPGFASLLDAIAHREMYAVVTVSADMLAGPAFARSCLQAGITEVHVIDRGGPVPVSDALSG